MAVANCVSAYNAIFPPKIGILDQDVHKYSAQHTSQCSCSAMITGADELELHFEFPRRFELQIIFLFSDELSIQ